MLESYDVLPTVQNAKHDKISLRMGDWLIPYDSTDGLETFIARLCPPPSSTNYGRTRTLSPPIGSILTGEDDWGWIFRRDSGLGNNSNRPLKLRIRTRHPSIEQPPPLFSGTATIFRNANISSEQVARMRIDLNLNPTRYAHFQTPWSPALNCGVFGYRRRRRRQSEYSLDGNDNVLLGNRERIYSHYWSNLLDDYFQRTHYEIDREIRRSSRVSSQPEPIFQANLKLDTIEVYWEISFNNAHRELDRIAPIINLFGRQSYNTEYFRTERSFNGRSISATLQRGMKLSVYTKTEKRLRFEIRFNSEFSTGRAPSRRGSNNDRIKEWCNEYAEIATEPIRALFGAICNHSAPSSTQEDNTTDFLSKFLYAGESSRDMRKILISLIHNGSFCPISQDDRRIVTNLVNRNILETHRRRSGVYVVHSTYRTSFEETFN